MTTVAALGWASTEVTFSSSLARLLVVGPLTLSAVLGIFTLGLIPLVAEDLNEHSGSIYKVRAKFNLLWMWPPSWRLSLKWVCWPQHVLFIVGIVAFGWSAVSDVIKSAG